MSTHRLGRRGFTLIEIIVVMVIVGILTSMALPRYVKTREVSMARDAASVVFEVATVQRMREADGDSWLLGAMTDACNGVACAAAVGGCIHVACGSMAKRGWDQFNWEHFACDTVDTTNCCVAGAVACGQRRVGDTPGTEQDPYKSWEYSVDSAGIFTPAGTDTPAL